MTKAPPFALGGLNKLFELSLEPEQVDVRQEKIENITEIFNTIPGVKIYLGTRDICTYVYYGG